MKNELIAALGWLVGIQGALGPAGRIFGDGPWGFLQKWWDVPTPVYLTLAVAGAALAIYGETAKHRART